MNKLEILSEQQNHKCCYCGVRFADPPNRSMATIEHVRRFADGGKTGWANEVAACRHCNNRRGDIDAYLFFEFRIELLRLRRRVTRLNKAEKRKRYRRRINTG